jgi:ATP-binding cassette subfamily B protein
MKSDILISELYGFTCDLLESNQDVAVEVGGYSMYPSLKPGDLIKIRRFKKDQLEIGDIIVFNKGNKWIAHRIRKVFFDNGKKFFITKGDSCVKEDLPVNELNVIAKVVEFSRKGERFDIRSTLSCFKKDRQTQKSAILFLFNRIWIRLLFLKRKIFKNLTETQKSLRFLTVNSRRILSFNVFLSIVLGLLPLITIYIVKWLIDEMTRVKFVSIDPWNYWLLYLLVFGVGVTFLLLSVLSILSRLARERLSQSVSVYVYGLLHEKYTNLDLEYLEDSNNQDKIHRAVQEAGLRPNKMINQYLLIWQSLASCIFIAVLLFSIHWSVFFIVLVSIIPGFWVKILSSRNYYNLSRLNTRFERAAFYYNRILTGFSFAKESMLFGYSNFFIKKFTAAQDRVYLNKNSVIRRNIGPELYSQVFAFLLIVFSFGFVIYLAILGYVTLGTVMLFFLIFQRGYSVVKELFQSIAGLYEDNVFIRDFFSFINLPTNRDKKPAEKSEMIFQERIVFENVSFHYPSSTKNVINGLSMEIVKGKTIALVGKNGSGKSTLIKLLCGFYKPQNGVIRFDDKDIFKININTLRSQITAVFQDFSLYNLTAEENIFLGDINRGKSIDFVRDAAQKADISKVIEKLPLSYKTVIGNLFEKGEDLSIGQWQKMAIARAYYRNSPILLLDEPSSALDSETEQEILGNLRKLAEDKTVVIVSHRFSTIRWADMIYFLERGEIVEFGSHQELMHLEGRYFKMYNSAII